MKKIYLALFLISGFAISSINAQLMWDVDPVDFTLECNDDDNDGDIEAYLNDLVATAASCANAADVTWDYTNPGNFEDGDVIQIEITAEDDCSVEPSLIENIEITIEDTEVPTIDDLAESETEECDLPNNAALLAAWVADHAGATYLDDCTDAVDFTWFTNPDPVDILDIALSCGGSITVDFWVEDAAQNSSEVTTATFTLEDSTDPSFDDAPGVWDMTFECDGTGNLTELTDWVASIEAGINVSDNCLDAATLLESMTNDWDGAEFPNCDGPDVEIEFEIEDECGLTSTYTATAQLADTQDPIIGTAATDLVLVCDPATNDTDISDWLDLVGNAVFNDDCAALTDLIISNDYSGTTPDCDSGPETVTFTIEDECGNTVETSADIIIDDIEIPTIVSIETAPATIECVNEEITGEGFEVLINGIIDAAVGMDVNDCTEPDDLIWIVTPDPATPPQQADNPDPNCPGGTLTGTYLFDVFVEDECGNQSTIETITITVEDTQDPIEPGTLPQDETYDCPDEVPGGMDLFPPDDCEAPPAILMEVIISDVCPIEIERTWILEDYCGNQVSEHIQTIIVDDLDAPEWIGDEDDFLPEDIQLVLANCDQPYVFPGGFFADLDGNEWTIYPPMDGSEFEDNCGATFSQIGPGPSDGFDAGVTQVTYIITDECGNSTTHEFEVNIICATCEGGGVVCNNSCETMTGGCHTCDIQDLLDGFDSCTPNWTGGTEPWPSDLCPAAASGFVPNNMSWFSFVAGGDELCVTVTVGDCAAGSNGSGMQTGMYTACEDDDGECLGGDVDCGAGSASEISFSVADLIIGNTYYIFVDGCAGAECDYEIEVEKGFAFIIDTPEEVVVEASCEQPPNFPVNTFCPETILQLDIFHAGDSPSDQGEYDDPGPYNPELDADFYWTFNPPIEGMTDGVWNSSVDEDGINIPPLSFSNVTTETVFEICLTDIIADCSAIDCDDCCTFITIAPLPDELFGPYDVCLEDLLDANGWDPGDTDDDPNGDGIEWIGPNNISLDQVEDAIENNMGILSYDVFDPDCNCSFNQSVIINPVGNVEPVEVTLYMFDCQFRDEDGELDFYEWEWPEDNYDLTVDMDEEPFTIIEGSLIRDWDNSRCDSLLIVTVDTAIVNGTLTQGPCTPLGTEYCFELLVDELVDNHEFHPIISPDYATMKWIDATSGTEVAIGPCFDVTVNNAGMYFVEIEYSFLDGAYDPLEAIFASCIKRFGPFDLDSGTALSPEVTGESSFCINDLTGKLFNVIDPVDSYEYEWTFQGGATGITLNSPANDMAEIDFTNYDFAGNLPILIVANTPCGQSEAFEVFVGTIELPVPDFTLTTPICVGQLASAEFVGDQDQVLEYMWSIDNYNSGNQSGPGPISYSTSSAGTFDVSLIIVNLEGCQSEPVTKSFEVIAPLEAPVLDCTETASSVGFSWLDIAGATGYEITVLNHPTMTLGTVINNTTTELSVDFPGLSVNSIVEISVVATGDLPCGNGPASTIECQAQDCPDPDWVFNVWADTSFCINGLIDAYTFDVSGVNGTAAFSSTVPGVVDVNGLIVPSAFPVGNTPITMTYTYQNGDCERSRSINVEVFAEPSATFVPSVLELCLGESLTIDDSNVDDVAIWDYGVDGSIDANGEVSWMSSGATTICVSVTTPELSGSCVNSSCIDIMVLDTLIMGEITCIGQDLNFVEFDWDDVVGATGYDISYTVNNGTPVTVLNIDDSGILIDNLIPEDEVVITVTALSPNQCSDVTRTADCVAVSCIPLIFENPVCAEEGIDFVLFEWDAVIGATMYEVSINNMVIGLQDSLTYFVDGLSPGDIVTISVTAINDLDNCADVTRTKDCVAGDCPEATFTFTPVTEKCYNAALGGIQLVTPVINGVAGTGTGSWNSIYVDDNGLFTPDDEIDMIYMLEYEYVEGTCEYAEELQVEIIIIPEGRISVSDDDICVTETTVIEGFSEFGNNETAIWDFGPGVNAVGSGFGPYDVTFDAAGTYEISLTLDNEDCLSNPILITIEVDPELITPDITCTSTNTFVNFNWDDVDGVSQYNITINDVFQITQANSDFRVDGLLEGDLVDIIIGFVTDNSCGLEDLESSCTTTACPSSFFVLQNYDNEICLDDTQSNVQLDITLMDGPDGEVGVGSWSGDGISPTGLFNPTDLSGDIELTYSIEFTECFYDTSVNIVVYEAPEIIAINPINPDCYMDNMSQPGGLNPEVSGGTAPYTYTVDNLPSQDFPAFIEVLNIGTHELLVTDANGCTATQSIEILAAIEPDIDIEGAQSILIGESGEYTLNTTASNIGDVIWYANDILICQGTDCDVVTILSDDDRFEGADFVDLSVQVIFNIDCFVETNIRVEFFELQKYYIPNVISELAENPENQTWAIYTKGGDILVKTVKIYDRWGELIHDQPIDENTEGRIDLLWNGRWTEVGGDEVIPGVYVYMIELEVEGREVIEAGDITVIR